MKTFIHCDDPEAEELMVVEKNTGEILQNVKSVDLESGRANVLILEKETPSFEEVGDGESAVTGAVSRPLTMKFVEKEVFGDFEVRPKKVQSFVKHHCDGVAGDEFENLDTGLVVKTKLNDEEMDERWAKLAALYPERYAQSKLIP